MGTAVFRGANIASIAAANLVCWEYCSGSRTMFMRSTQPSATQWVIDVFLMVFEQQWKFLAHNNELY